MKMKAKLEERLEYHIEARKAEKNVEPIPFAGHVCEKCGKTLEIDEVHKCPHEKSLAELANETAAPTTGWECTSGKLSEISDNHGADVLREHRVGREPFLQLSRQAAPLQQRRDIRIASHERSK